MTSATNCWRPLLRAMSISARSLLEAALDQSDVQRLARELADRHRQCGRLGHDRAHRDRPGDLPADPGQPAHDPGGGADNFISSVALTSGGQIYIGGGFTSFDGQQRNSVARLTANGFFSLSSRSHRTRLRWYNCSSSSAVVRNCERRESPLNAARRRCPLAATMIWRGIP